MCIRDRWVHSTLWQLPANSVIHVKAYEYDTGDAFRNQFKSQVTGVIGGHIDLVSTKINGKVTTLNQSVNLYNSNVAPYVGHSFSVPSLNINVPLKGLSPATPVNFLCAAAPCAPTNDHTLTTFSFKTRGPGLYRWQCFIPVSYTHLDVYKRQLPPRVLPKPYVGLDLHRIVGFVLGAN